MAQPHVLALEVLKIPLLLGEALCCFPYLFARGYRIAHSTLVPHHLLRVVATVRYRAEPEIHFVWVSHLHPLSDNKKSAGKALGFNCFRHF